MITRVVRMTFRPDAIKQFLSIFNSSKEKIRSFPGCLKLELLRDSAEPCVFVTISHWAEAEDLENYRNSELFKSTWGKTRPLFSAKAMAYSLDSVYKLD